MLNEVKHLGSSLDLFAENEMLWLRLQRDIVWARRCEHDEAGWQPRRAQGVLLDAMPATRELLPVELFDDAISEARSLTRLLYGLFLETNGWVLVEVE
jgi:hypothetical protein